MENLKVIAEAQAVANRWLRIHARSQKALYKVIGVAYGVYRQMADQPDAVEEVATRCGVKVRRDAPNRLATMVLKMVIQPEAHNDLRTAFAAWAKVLVWLHERDADPALAVREIGDHGGISGVVTEVNAASRTAAVAHKEGGAKTAWTKVQWMDGQQGGLVDLKPGYVILVARVTEDRGLVEVQVAGQDDATVNSTLAALKNAAETEALKPDAASEGVDATNDNGTRPDVSAAIKVAPPVIAKSTVYSNSVFSPQGAHQKRRPNSEWYTPEWLLEPLYEAMDGHPFDLDPCSPTKGAGAPVRAKRHFTVEDDGLSQEWQGRCYLNPPYSDLEPWLRKAADATWCRGMSNPPTEEAGRRAHPLCEAVVALIPARTHTLYWKKYVDDHARVLFLQGKISFLMPTSEGFVEAKTRFPEGLAFVVWGNHKPFTQALLTAQLRCRGVSDRSGELSDAPWESYWKHRPHLRVQGQQGEAA